MVKIDESIFPREYEIPAEAMPLVCEQDYYYANGEKRKWDGPREEITSPVMVRKGGRLERLRLGSSPLMDSGSSLDCLKVASIAYDRGQGKWPRMSPEERMDICERFISKVTPNRGEMIRRTMFEIAKTRKDAESEFDRTIEYMRNTIKEYEKMLKEDKKGIDAEGYIGRIHRAPLGPVLCVAPFNYPFNETYTTFFPAILTGNTVVLKNPKHGTLLLEPLLEAYGEFPAGVVNTVYGDGATTMKELIPSGLARHLAFIGSTRVADILISQDRQPHRLTRTLGLGAKNPNIILKDSDINFAAELAVKSAFGNTGQRCTANKLTLAHYSIARDFVDAIEEKVEKLKIGMPYESGVQITPHAEPSKPRRLKEYELEAVHKGARVVNPSGGQLVGSIYSPTVLYRVTPEMSIYHEEQFGALMPITTFRTLDEVIEMQKASPYRQQVSITGRDISKISYLYIAFRNMGHRININSPCQRGPDSFPFGASEDSGEGSLSLREALERFTHTSVLAGTDNSVNRSIIEAIY